MRPAAHRHVWHALGWLALLLLPIVITRPRFAPAAGARHCRRCASLAPAPRAWQSSAAGSTISAAHAVLMAISAATLLLLL